MRQVRSREGEPLGEVVELEHPLLADHQQLAALGGGEPVHVDHAGRPGREVEQAEEQVLVRGVLPLGELRVDAGGTLPGDPAQHVDIVGGEVHGHPHVADAGGKRAGAPAGDRVHGGQPALPQQPAELQDRGVVALDMAHLDRDSPGPPGAHDLERLSRRRGERLLDEDRDPPLDRREGQGDVGGGRRGDDERVDLRLAGHGERVAPAGGTGLAGRRGEHRGVGIADRDQARLRMGGDDAQVVAPHGPEARQGDAQG